MDRKNRLERTAKAFWRFASYGWFHLREDRVRAILLNHWINMSQCGKRLKSGWRRIYYDLVVSW